MTLRKKKAPNMVYYLSEGFLAVNTRLVIDDTAAFYMKLHLTILMGLFLLATLPGCSSTPEKQLEVVRGDDVAVAPERMPLEQGLIFNLLAGEFAGVRGHLDEAMGYYGRAASISDDPAIINRAAYISLYSGNDQQAAELCERWQDLDYGQSHSMERICLMANLHMRRLDPVLVSVEQLLMLDGEVNESAISTLTHILSKESTPTFALEIAAALNEKYPESPFLMLLLARFQANQQMYEKALVNVNRLIELESEIVDAYLVKAQVLAGLGRQKESIDAVAMVVEKRPRDNRLRLQYARMLVQFKAFDEAIEQFLVLKKSMSNDENVLLSLGLLSIETGKHNDAKHYLQTLLDEGHHNQQAHYYLGRIQQSQGEDMPAIANYERVLSGEYRLDAQIRAASLMARSGQYEKALARLELLAAQPLQSESDRIKLYLAKGEVLRAASRDKEAFSLYNDALNLSPENTDLLYARALTAEKLDLLDVAESDLKMVLMHEPENASALNALGYTLADRTQRYSEARDYILKAAQLLPDDPAILDSLGWVYYRLGQLEDAIKWLTRAFEALQDAEIAAHLGEVLWVSGQTEKAESIWQKGKQLDGNQAILRDTIQRFK